jgi:hypothetical protein
MKREKRQVFTSKAWVMCLGVVVLWISFCTALQAGQSVTLAWNPDSGTNIAGYALYYGTNSGNYTTRLDAGTNTAATATNLQPGLIYYFAVTAYNAARVESGRSAPISYLVPGILTMTPATKTTPVIINFPVSPGHTYAVQASADLKTWTNLWQMGSATSNAWVSFQDSQSGSFNKRFYRLAMSP